MKVAVGASSFGESAQAINLLLEKNISVIKNPYGRKMSKPEIVEHLQGVSGLLAGLEPLDEEVLRSATALKAVARIGIGMDNVDLSAAQKLGIKVSNTPNGPTVAVAEMTLAALLAISRQIIFCNQDMHDKKWNKRMGLSIKGLRVFLIGYGRIGQAVAQLLKPLGANLMIYDPLKPELSVAFEEGLRHADVISLHAGGKGEVLSSECFSQMKRGVIILNSARGGLINEAALYQALQEETVSAFWGDAFWEEPYTGKLTECENAILTPHISTYSRQCREQMEMEAVQNLLRDLM